MWLVCSVSVKLEQKKSFVAAFSLLFVYSLDLLAWLFCSASPSLSSSSRGVLPCLCCFLCRVVLSPFIRSNNKAKHIIICLFRDTPFVSATESDCLALSLCLSFSLTPSLSLSPLLPLFPSALSANSVAKTLPGAAVDVGVDWQRVAALWLGQVLPVLPLPLPLPPLPLPWPLLLPVGLLFS